MTKRKRRSKGHPSRTKADESFQAGPLRVSRFGKRILYENRMTSEQHRELTSRLAGSYDDVVRQIDQQVAELVARIRRHHPIELLRCAYGMFAVSAFGKKSEPEWSSDENASVWTLEYIFSVAASTSAESFGKETVTEKDYAGIANSVQALMHTLNFSFAIASSAKRKVEGSIQDDDYEAHFTRSQMHWSCVRKSRYSVHDGPFLRTFLGPHSEVIERVFGISADALVDGIEKIAHAHAGGMAEAFAGIAQIHSEFFERLGTQQISSAEELVAKLAEMGLDEGMRRFGGQLLGDDLFDVQKVTTLPEPLLDALSWTPGEDSDFLAHGLYSGWPLRVSSIRRRPFLKIDGRYYSHISYGLVDHVYRVLEKAIRKEASDYATTWKERQQDVSERFPIELLQRLLPGCTVYRSVFYQWPPTASSDKNWCEVDALVCYDDHLFVIEAKAGAFTYTSPATDFAAHVESIRGLVHKPAAQAARFVEYLSSRDNVSLHAMVDGERVVVGQMARGDFRVITPCGVTLDNFTHLAVQAHLLESLGVDLKGRTFWSVCVDDLMVHADIFDSPMQFAHFIEQRQSAIAIPKMFLIDEIDHLGMYLTHNHYATRVVKELGDSMGMWTGYSASLDTYFHDLAAKGSAEKPSQEMPPIYRTILPLLDSSREPGRCRVASWLLDYGKEGREDVARAVEQALSGQKEKGRPQPALIGGESADATICVFQPGITWTQAEAIRHAQRSLVVSRKERHLLFFLTFNEADALTAFEWQFLFRSQLEAADLAALEEEAVKLREARVEKARRLRDRPKIGRNEPCPCGSRLKFKRCCGSH